MKLVRMLDPMHRDIHSAHKHIPAPLMTALPFLPGAMILLIQFGWKELYLFKHIPGIYWLFIMMDRYYAASLVAAFMGSAIFLALTLLQKSTSQKRTYFSRVNLAFLTAGIAILCTFPMTFAQNSTHMESIQAGGRIYNLAAYPMFDVNLSVAECDPVGIFCTTIYRSHDITDMQWKKSHLAYNAQGHLLSLQTPNDGIIFSYAVR